MLDITSVVSTDKPELYCDTLIRNCEDKATFEGRTFWYFDRPFVGSGMIYQRLVRILPGQPFPKGYESFKDSKNQPVPEGGVCLFEYRDPVCRYCGSAAPEEFHVSDSCKHCGGREWEITEMETLFITVEDGHKPQARNLR